MSIDLLDEVRRSYLVTAATLGAKSNSNVIRPGVHCHNALFLALDFIGAEEVS